jgi:esterase/lipase superfamily enzyme
MKVGFIHSFQKKKEIFGFITYFVTNFSDCVLRTEKMCDIADVMVVKVCVSCFYASFKWLI